MGWTRSCMRGSDKDRGGTASHAQAYAWEKVPCAVLRTAQGTVFNAVALNKGFASHVELWNQIPALLLISWLTAKRPCPFPTKQDQPFCPGQVKDLVRQMFLNTAKHC